jgi:hypothetical protein
MRIHRSLAAAVLSLSTIGAAHAYQDARFWEFSIFYGQSSLDDVDVLEESFTTFADANQNDTVGQVRFERSLDIEDDSFVGARIGYLWNPFLQSEFVYDKNRTHATYSHKLTETETAARILGAPDYSEKVEGGVSATFVTYQLGLLVHPLATRPVRWQPFGTLSIGLLDANLDPADGTRSRIKNSAATEVLHVPLDDEDRAYMLSYGLGCKFYAAEFLALRLDLRQKTSELFEERRTDTEITFGVAFYAPGVDY